MANNEFMHSKERQETIYKAIQQFAKALGCDASKEGGKEFARMMLPAIAVAAYEGGDILNDIATKLLTFHPQNGPR